MMWTKSVVPLVGAVLTSVYLAAAVDVASVARRRMTSPFNAADTTSSAKGCHEWRGLSDGLRKTSAP